MLEQSFYIAKLISHYLAENIQPQELQELDDWRSASSANEALFQKLCNKEYIKQQVLGRKQFKPQNGWLAVERKINKTRQKTILWKVSRYAALLMIPLMIGLLITQWSDDSINPVAKLAPPSSPILPGEKKAILTLDNGEVIDLKALKNTQLKEKDGTDIQVASSTLNYQSAMQAPTTQKTSYNKIEIPRGGEYSLFLSDGTKVYLNSMSSLRFPVQFREDRRVVELQGEAYFEVSKNGKPFIVKTQNAEVEVLGTTFNVSAYQGEEYQATLLTGSVNIHTQEINQLLKPAEQARILPGAKEITIHKVDVQDYTSWINGKIHFKDKRLEEIMHTLSRWYDMTVVYENPQAKNLRFGCNVDRDKEITPFLELLESTKKVSITIQKKRITIK